jgi:ubiquinone biosynthesis protein UbiJ
MKKTPQEVSRALQKLRQEAEMWRAATAKAQGDPEKTAFGQAEVARCAKEMKKLYRQGKKQFWS